MNDQQPNADQTQQVSKTESVVVYGTFLKRLLASFIDGFIIGVINFTLSMSISLSNLASEVGTPDEVAESIALLLSLIIALLSTSLNILYYVGFLIKKGATPGKMALGLVVVKEDQSKLSFGSAILRETIGKFVSALVLGLGYLWVIWDERKQGWHDKIAGTIVVEKKSITQ